jgi:hypothetical protein
LDPAAQRGSADTAEFLVQHHGGGHGDRHALRVHRVEGTDRVADQCETERPAAQLVAAATATVRKRKLWIGVSGSASRIASYSTGLRSDAANARKPAFNQLGSRWAQYVSPYSALSWLTDYSSPSAAEAI